MERNEASGVRKDGGSSNGSNMPYLDRSKVRILLCDNDAKSSKEVFTLLSKCSYQVTSVRTPRQVIDALNAEGPDIDIILAEVDLPVTKGLKLLKYIMHDEQLRRIPIIMMSAQDEVSVVVKCLKLGAADYLVKPLRTNELLNLWTLTWRRRQMRRTPVMPIPTAQLYSQMTQMRSPMRSTILENSILNNREAESNAAASVEPALNRPSEYYPDVLRPIQQTVHKSAEVVENYHKGNSYPSSETIPGTTYTEKSCAPVSLEFHQSRNSKKEHPSTVLMHPSNEAQVNIPGLPSLTSLPYYMHGMMNQVMMPSSVQMSQGNQHDFGKHASTMLPQYNSLPQCSTHVPMMPSFPYYPVSVCMQTGQMPATHHWHPNASFASTKVKPDRTERREAALIKFRQKRKDRCFDKKIRYINRKRLAERRPRVRGQFVRQMNGVDVDLNGQPINAGDSDEDDEEEEL
ncbi:hypothetical protein IFM89_017190 [Coptis chinensis]|uniref:Two-component response regulator-like APRR1 n=1 Tax=Coptis chinensis TaxID=261450 RepID=A0A835MCX5_9MAGN|nr:hypothetical protein IFM89_017190 [Coptis chinensis]